MVTKNHQIVTADANENRRIGLDLLRAYAALSVVYGHGWFLAQYLTQSNLYFLTKFDNVTMFFVMTGFLIYLKLSTKTDADQISLGNC